MSFADDLDALIAPKQPKGCQVCHLIGDDSPLEPGLRAKLKAAVDGGVGAERLARVMAQNGHVVPKQHTYDHRNERHGG